MTTDKNKIIHLLVTEKCDRNCVYCCNKQYNLKKVPVITREELENAKMILLTGGEPVRYFNFFKLSLFLKEINPNVKIILYANAFEYLLFKIEKENSSTETKYLDGLSLSIKNHKDLKAFDILISESLISPNIKSNRLYIFDNLLPHFNEKDSKFQFIKREWQEDFKPAEDSIFRRL